MIISYINIIIKNASNKFKLVKELLNNRKVYLKNLKRNRIYYK